MTKKHKKICEKIWMERNDYLGAIKEAFEAGMKEERKRHYFGDARSKLESNRMKQNRKRRKP